MYVVTGGAGFIGSVLVAALAEAGLGPIVIADRFGKGDQWKNLVKHPVSDVVLPDNLLDYLQDNRSTLSGVFHLGASSSTTETDVDFILSNNFSLSRSIWDFCTEAGVPLIYASSAATYGDGALGFVDDNDPAALQQLRPLNPYGWSKKLFDDYAVAASNAGRQPPFWGGLKFFNVYGPNEYHKAGQRSVTVQLYEQVANAAHLKLFKSHNPDYSDGGQMRDFVWVDDCADVMVWMLKSASVAGVYNCGSGTARSFNDLARAVFVAMEKEPVIDYIDTPDNIRDQYQYFTEADMSRLRAAGYDKPFTTLEDGVHAYIRDYLSTDDPYR